MGGSDFDIFEKPATIVTDTKNIGPVNTDPNNGAFTDSPTAAGAAGCSVRMQWLTSASARKESQAGQAAQSGQMLAGSGTTVGDSAAADAAGGVDSIEELDRSPRLAAD